MNGDSFIITCIIALVIIYTVNHIIDKIADACVAGKFVDKMDLYGDKEHSYSIKTGSNSYIRVEKPSGDLTKSDAEETDNERKPSSEIKNLSSLNGKIGDYFVD